ncbi:MAG TPA: LacI family DNA-binding transcriptional regulator [Capsulimonadaceae bacterium]|nr:LacI family DNA-binding transcriptional regulator [Capsulimonadaceae bacterium]
MSSIFEVAKQAGVSPSTVSRTFNSPHLINDKTKKRILEVAERINYRPLSTRGGREAQRETTGAYGFHFFAERPEDTLQGNAFYSQVLAGALAEASALGLRLILSTSGRHDSDAPLPALMRDSALAGSLLVGETNAKMVSNFEDKLENIVFVDTHDPSGRYDCVVSDNFGGALDAINYLIGLGHTRIGFVTSADETDSYNGRLYGYVSAHFRAGLPLDRSLMVSSADGSLDAIRPLLRRRDRPTAIMGASDDCAILVMKVCHELGIAIPRDLSLVGFDDLQASAYVIPPMTSVHVPTETIGRLGVRRLHAKIQEAATGLVSMPSRTLVPVTLVERASCLKHVE